MPDVVILKAGKHSFRKNAPVPRQSVIRLNEVSRNILIAGQLRPVPFKILEITDDRFVLYSFRHEIPTYLSRDVAVISSEK